LDWYNYDKFKENGESLKEEIAVTQEDLNVEDIPF